MLTFILRRMFVMLPTLFGVTVITFFAVRAIGRDPILAAMESGEMKGANTAQVIAEYKARKGYDQPIPVQYARWLGRVATGDFGVSVKDNRPVLEKMWERVPVTLLFSTISILLVYLISVPLGVYSAVKKGTAADQAVTTTLFMLYSLPDFWLATVLILLLCGGDYLNIFPAIGLSSQGAENMTAWQWLTDRLWHMVLPIICLTYGGLASVSRYQRTAMVEVLAQDFIRTARAKGLPERLVLFKHGLRNALIPIATLAGTLLPTLFAGSVVVERIFEIPGMGRLGFEAVLNGDTDVIMAVTLTAAVSVMAGLLLTDLMYAWIDPRIALGGKGSR